MIRELIQFTDVFHANTLLMCNALVQAIQNIDFKAGQQIELYPGFEIELGATLVVTIEDCMENFRLEKDDFEAGSTDSGQRVIERI